MINYYTIYNTEKGHLMEMSVYSILLLLGSFSLLFKVGIKDFLGETFLLSVVEILAAWLVLLLKLDLSLSGDLCATMEFRFDEI